MPVVIRFMISWIVSDGVHVSTSRVITCSTELVAKVTGTRNSDVSSERAHDIAFGQNPDYVLISIGDHCGADPMLVEDFDRVAKRHRRLDRDDGIAFTGQDGFDCHGRPP